MRLKCVTAAVLGIIPFATYAQSGKSIGAAGAEGFLEIRRFEDLGWFSGDDAVYRDDLTTQTTVWSMGFLFYDGSTNYWGDSSDLFAPHAESRPAGGPREDPDARTMTNTGIAFPGNGDLTANLHAALSSPFLPSARVTWSWTFRNAGATTIDLRFTWFVDADDYLQGSSFDDDLVAITDSATNRYGAIALGESNGAGGIRMRSSLLMDSETLPHAICGIAYGNGAGFFWSDQFAYAGIGAGSAHGIHPSLVNTIGHGRETRDVNGDFISDGGTDVAGAMEWRVIIPPGGESRVIHSLTWGGSQDVQPGSWSGPPPPTPWGWMLH